jgi:hypothetical protein
MHSLYNTKRVVRNIVLQVSFIGDLHQEVGFEQGTSKLECYLI